MTAATGNMADVLESLNLALLEAEVRFIAASSGTSAEIALTEDGAKLIYGKEGGEWGFSVQTPKGGTCDLGKANLKHRVAAAHALPQMETALLLACEERVKEIRAAVAAVAAWSKTTELSLTPKKAASDP